MLAARLIVPLLFYVAGALLATGPGWRRTLCFVPAMSGLLAPFALPEEWRVARAITALFLVAFTIRASDLVFHKDPTTRLARLFHAVSVVDSFKMRRVPRLFDARTATRTVLFAALMFAGRALVVNLAPLVPSHAGSLAVRWLGALVWVYGLSDMAYGAVVVVNRGLGLVGPVIDRDPVLSRSVREFWGRRWNRIVGAWLDARFYRSLARRGHPLLGIALAFVVSTLIHVYVALPALGAEWAAVVGGFFVLQGLLAVVEGPLQVARWNPAASHVWTLAVIGGTSPLFCEAFLRVMGS